ncbi:MAG: ABC-2 family transporter protein [Deltaproteobacteria bacterium]|nr:ABC-2 family transporter protein [Deltaproteobacteria bacterium]
MARWGRAMPTLLKVGFAETLAYRAEFIIWMLTMTLPLVMLGLWTSVASEGPFAGYQQADFVAYYLGAFIVRNLTGNWVVWQMNEEIRTGSLMQRLLKPIHPFVTYVATHISAIPLRALVALPLAVILLATQGAGLLITDAPRIGLLLVALLGTFVLTFCLLVTIGALGFFLERSLALVEVYLGIFAVFSGYLVPLDLFPAWLQNLAAHLPFRYMLAFPVELLIGKLSFDQALVELAIQGLWVVIIGPLALLVWSLGVRKFEAYGS